MSAEVWRIEPFRPVPCSMADRMRGTLLRETKMAPAGVTCKRLSGMMEREAMQGGRLARSLDSGTDWQPLTAIVALDDMATTLPGRPSPGRTLYFRADVSSIGISKVAGATLPSFHVANDSVTFALPLPASAGTRTGP